MKTGCPNCPCDAIGTEAASVCVECNNAAIAGVSMDLPILLTISISLIVAWKLATRLRIGKMLKTGRLSWA